jgi:hypothetical protein
MELGDWIGANIGFIQASVRVFSAEI